jgi:hypothetical protein
MVLLYHSNGAPHPLPSEGWWAVGVALCSQMHNGMNKLLNTMFLYYLILQGGPIKRWTTVKFYRINIKNIVVPFTEVPAVMFYKFMAPLQL